MKEEIEKELPKEEQASNDAQKALESKPNEPLKEEKHKVHENKKVSKEDKRHLD